MHQLVLSRVMMMLQPLGSWFDLKIFTRYLSDDDELIAGCIAGKRDMQRRLYDKYVGKMMALCLRYAKTSFEAEDVLQEGFVKVFGNI